MNKNFNVGNSMPEDENDWARDAAAAIVNDLKDRRGIRQAFDEVDADIQDEIVLTIAEIIRESAPKETQVSDKEKP